MSPPLEDKNRKEMCSQPVSPCRWILIMCVLCSRLKSALLTGIFGIFGESGGKTVGVPQQEGFS